MKRALLAAVLFAALTACGDADTPPETGDTTTTVAPAPTTTATTTTTTPPPAPVATVEAPVEPAPVQPPAVEPPPVEPPPAEAPAAYYKNCDAARAAGAAPIHQGEPGYRAGLDRDGDGIACDK